MAESGKGDNWNKAMLNNFALSYFNAKNSTNLEDAITLFKLCTIWPDVMTAVWPTFKEEYLVRRASFFHAKLEKPKYGVYEKWFKWSFLW